MNTIRRLTQSIKNEEHMLIQSCNNLQESIDRLSEKGLISSETQSHMEQQLKKELSWSAANKVEIMLIDFYDDASLTTEWQRRLAEIHLLSPHLVNFYTSKITEESVDKDTLRAQLRRLITDLQWKRESSRVVRYHEGQMSKRIALFFLLSFVLFFSPTIARVLFSVGFDNLRIYYLFTAATSGILGATFSQLTSIQSRIHSATLDQVRTMSKSNYILARSIVGAGAGLIMFYLIQSGLLNGAFFPDFIDNTAELGQAIQELTPPEAVADQVSGEGVAQKIEFNLAIGTLANPSRGFSLLIIWCLMAGFSEKMIPGILNSKSQEATAEK